MFFFFLYFANFPVANDSAKKQKVNYRRGTLKKKINKSLQMFMEDKWIDAVLIPK